MKLRNKLAVVLASAMVMSAVPVVTMAASTNSMASGIMTVKEDTVFETSATAPAVSIEFKNFKATETFYLTLEGAEWNEDGNGNLIDGTSTWSKTGVTLTVIDDETAKVEVTDAAALTNNTLELPLLTKVTENTAKVTISAKGSTSTVSESTFVFATTTEEVGTAKVGTATSFNKDGKIAKITLTEAYKNAFKTVNNQYALIELNDSDFEFDMRKGIVRGTTGEAVTSGKYKGYKKYKVLANYTYGFGGKGLTEGGQSYVVAYVASDASCMYVELPNTIEADSMGSIELKDLHVKSTVKKPSEGNLTVDISGDIEELNNATVAVIGDYAAVVTTDKVVDINAGQTKEVEFTLAEGVCGTFTKGREIEFKLTNGYFVDAVMQENNEDEVDDAKTEEKLISVLSSIEFKVDDKTKEKFSNSSALETLITDVETNDDDKVVGFTIKPEVAYSATDINSFVITADISASLEQSGEIAVEVSSRDLEEDVTGVIANIKGGYKVTSEAAVLKAGLKDQVAGNLAIAESEAGLLEKGSKLVIALPKVNGITFSTNSDKKPQVKVTAGDLQVGDVKVTTTKNSNGETVPAVTVEIKRASKEAATVEISNFHVDTDRTVAEGAYDIEIAGNALTDLSDVITVKDFIRIGTANTEDIIASNGLAKGTSTFVIGEAKYTMNGVEKTMDAASYIQDPGYTMIPVRYVAEAFGVAGNDILFSNGTATIFAGNRTIQLTNGSNVAVVNGAKFTMGTKVVIKEGRTYAPVGEVARLLGVSTQWDNTTKTATFTNK